MIDRKKSEQWQVLVISMAAYLALASATQAHTNEAAKPAAGRAYAPTTHGANAMLGGGNMHGVPQAHAFQGPGGTNTHFAQAHGANIGAGPQHHQFAYHDVAHFSRADWDHWHHGQWRNSCFGGRCGWWWFAGGQWYFYERPIYPYPLFVSEIAYVEPVVVAPAPIVVQPAPVVVAPPPAPVFVVPAAPVVVAPAPVFVAPAPVVVAPAVPVVVQR